MSNSALNIEKYVGTGNDFIIVDGSQTMAAEILGLHRAEAVRRICHRQLGAGADGLIFLDRKKKDTFSWEFYNSNGSTAKMCGNATRCVGRWAFRNHGLYKLDLMTAVGLVRIEADEHEVTSYLEYLKLGFKEFAAESDGKRTVATFVNTGVPHAVIELDTIDRASSVEMRKIINAFRFHPGAGSEGTNVTFLQRDPGGSKQGELLLTTTTFERGVEGFTLSCGTGVLAAAAVTLRMAQVSDAGLPQIICKVKTPGGELTVRYGTRWEGASLMGPADFIYGARISSEFFDSI